MIAPTSFTILLHRKHRPRRNPSINTRQIPTPLRERRGFPSSTSSLSIKRFKLRISRCIHFSRSFEMFIPLELSVHQTVLLVNVVVLIISMLVFSKFTFFVIVVIPSATRLLIFLDFTFL
jgi:hypothetical protein